MQPTVMVATLGGQPQVVTFALDALLARGAAMDEVVVLLPAGERYARSLRRLAEAFPGDRYQGRPCHLRMQSIGDQGRPLMEIQTTRDAEAVWKAIHDVVRHLKATGARLHLLLTGGRRLMALMAVSAALLHLEHGDRVWHLYTPDAVRAEARDGARLHVGPEAGIELIEVPLAPLGSYFPGMRPLLGASPSEIWAARVQQLDGEDRQHCRAVWEGLTSQQRKVLAEFARGRDRQQAAEALVLSVKTVDSHKSAILARCRQAWGLPEDERLDYHFLRRTFGPFLASLALPV